MDLARLMIEISELIRDQASGMNIEKKEKTSERCCSECSSYLGHEAFDWLCLTCFQYKLLKTKE